MDRYFVRNPFEELLLVKLIFVREPFFISTACSWNTLPECVCVSKAYGELIGTNHRLWSGKYRMNSSVSLSRCLIAVFFNSETLYVYIQNNIPININAHVSSAFPRAVALPVIIAIVSPVRLQSDICCVFLRPTVARRRDYQDERDPAETFRPPPSS